MSETQNIFIRPPRATRRRRRRSSGCGGWFLFPLFVLGLVAYGFWITRDTHPMARLIPREQVVQVFASDVLVKRGKIAASTVWRTFPESWGLLKVSERLNQDFGMPEWVLNNLIGPVCHVSGNDLQHFGDMLFVTQMRRIGCLVEKLHRLAPGIERDPAGGLHLRWVEELGLYYAVRGRILVMSPSREALVRAVTLREEDALDPDALARAVDAFGAEDLHGMVTFGEKASHETGGAGSAAPLARLGEVFTSLSFAARVDLAEACVKCRGALRPEWHTRLSGLLSGVSPQVLTLPPEGMLMVSADFGKSVREVWDGMAGLSKDPAYWAGLWDDWGSSAVEEDVLTMLARFFMGLLGPLGPGIRLSLCGIDLNEMGPVPEVAVALDASPQAIAGVLEAVPPVPEDMPPWESFPRYDPEDRRVHLPMLGGPSIEPTAVVYGDGLLVTTSRTLADALLARPAQTERLTAPGNLYLCVRPHPCVQAVYDAGMLLAENGLLKDHTPETFEDAMAPWLERSALVDTISVLLAHEAGEVAGVFNVVCRPRH